MAELGSDPANTALVPMPRIVSWPQPVFCENVTEGASARACSMVWVPRRPRSSCETALIAMGIACTACPPALVAVTIVSASSATRNVNDAIARSPARTRTTRPCRTKPLSSAEISYSPAGRSGNAKSPAAPVSAVWMATPRIVTRTPCKGAPVWSTMEPTSTATGCAAAGLATHKSIRAAANTHFTLGAKIDILCTEQNTWRIPSCASCPQPARGAGSHPSCCWVCLPSRCCSARRRATPSRRFAKCWCCNRSTAATSRWTSSPATSGSNWTSAPKGP